MVKEKKVQGTVQMKGGTFEKLCPTQLFYEVSLVDHCAETEE